MPDPVRADVPDPELAEAERIVDAARLLRRCGFVTDERHPVYQAAVSVVLANGRSTGLLDAARRASVAWAAANRSVDDVRRLYPLLGEAMDELTAVMKGGTDG